MSACAAAGMSPAAASASPTDGQGVESTTTSAALQAPRMVSVVAPACAAGFGVRDPYTIWCPALAQPRPSAVPTCPAPMIPMRMRSPLVDGRADGGGILLSRLVLAP